MLCFRDIYESLKIIEMNCSIQISVNKNEVNPTFLRSFTYNDNDNDNDNENDFIVIIT